MITRYVHYMVPEPKAWCRLNGSYEGQIIYCCKIPLTATLPLGQTMEIPSLTIMGDDSAGPLLCLDNHVTI